MVISNLSEVLDDKYKISQIKEKLDIYNNNDVRLAIQRFKNKKGLISTFLNYCKALNYEVEFVLYNDNEKKFKDKNLGNLLEKIRKLSNLNKRDFAKEKLNLSSYHYTYNSFKRNGCEIKKLYDIFENKLNYKLKYKIKEIEN